MWYRILIIPIAFIVVSLINYRLYTNNKASIKEIVLTSASSLTVLTIFLLKGSPENKLGASIGAFLAVIIITITIVKIKRIS
jgi:uncharacterized MnhB-related membrane protein